MDTEHPPELADWWVWGVRKAAGVVAALLMVVFALGPLFVLSKLIIWAITQEPSELYQAAGGVVVFIGLWRLRVMLDRFSAVREPPDLDRWLWRHRGR